MLTTWLIVGLAVGVIILTILFASWKNARKTIIFFGSAVGVAAAVGGVAFSFLELQELGNQYKLSVDQHKQSVTHSRQAVAFSQMEKFSSISLERSSEALKEIEGKTPQEIDQYLEGNPESGQALLLVFNFFEQVAFANKSDYADEETLCALFQEPAVRYYSRLSAWIEHYRDITGRHGAHEQYEWLFKRWRTGCPK